MALRERLAAADGFTMIQVKAESDDRIEQAYQDLKARVHYKVIEQIDLSVLGDSPGRNTEAELEVVIRQMLDEEPDPLSQQERENLVREIMNEVLGLGPLEPILADPSVSDILVNSYNQVFVERRGRLEKAKMRFRDDHHLMKIIDKIATAVGRRVDESSPMVDARLADGSRVNAIIPPLALDGPCMSIRKFAVDPLKTDDLIKIGSLTKGAARLLHAVVQSRLNVLISGGTGTGKTTLLNVLSSYIPSHERIVTIEDSAELQLQQDHVVRLETRPPNIEGYGEVTLRDLVRNALRMRPDRIVVGEVRGGEALDMMQAMNTGHDGSLTTIHANSPRDALSRLETMISMAGIELPDKAIRQQIASAIQVVIQLSRLSDGSRRLVSLQEITGMEGDTITMQEIFRYTQMGVDKRGKVIGSFGPTGIRPRCAERIQAHGIDLESDLFSTKEV
jgi:pilus assembly protein CpaF